jgi:hypothetical protein
MSRASAARLWKPLMGFGTAGPLDLPVQAITILSLD